MDIKLSQREQMMQPSGMVDVITSGINDFFLIEETDIHGQKWIKDVETIDGYLEAKVKNPSLEWINYKETGSDILEEEKDRATFAVIRQRGQDPIAPYEGVQWAETLLGEIPVPLLMQQIIDAAASESQYVNVSFETIKIKGQEQLSIRFNTIEV